MLGRITSALTMTCTQTRRPLVTVTPSPPRPGRETSAGPTQSALPIESAPLASQRACQVSPGRSANQPNTQCKLRRRRSRPSRLLAMSAVNGSESNRVNTASVGSSVVGQVTAWGRGG